MRSIQSQLPARSGRHCRRSRPFSSRIQSIYRCAQLFNRGESRLVNDETCGVALDRWRASVIQKKIKKHQLALNGTSVSLLTSHAVVLTVSIAACSTFKLMMTYVNPRFRDTDETPFFGRSFFIAHTHTQSLDDSSLWIQVSMRIKIT